ncbi:penicillin-binding protein [Prevotella communis]|uniref:penicillin-binding transpeptidase domain-containing protein n=1 Tax=Prevotella communis TaxID=2913614 RepID=UPI001EDBAB4A|nr:penicillin-binding transpeptidase domain-containing protein [Prevotella communis]UKK61485.1 penicillin-binding protein [Prevotella communis]UKK64311.1 penicillin-binding protein [Prevotella communis]
MKNTDELQVLGSDTKQKSWKWIAVVVSVILLAIACLLYNRCSSTDRSLPMTQEGSTISPALQYVADSLLQDKLKEINGLQGQVIIMNVQTGEVLAMVGRERDYEGEFQPCKNFAYQQEQGSLVKTASLLVALETGKVTLDDVVDTKDGVWIIDDDRTLRDHNWRRGGYGLMTLERALEVSSNIGISKTIWNLFKGHEQDYFNKFDSMNYGQPDSIVGIENLSPTSYHTPKDSDWINKDIIWSSIGYNRKMAAIQMLTFYNAIANNGKMVKPTLQPGITKVINEQIASRKNIESIQQALEHVVSQGLGKLAGSKRIKVAGKTGTTQVGEYYEGENTVSEYHLAFCGYFPADKPKYSMIVSLNKLGLPASGGAMAGEAFHNIVEWMIDNEMIK